MVAERRQQPKGAAAAPLVEANAVSVAYGGNLALEEISFTLNKGESLALIGPSGSGKSTLLNVIAGLRAPSSGELLIEGQPVAKGREGTALILQDYGLLPWKTVRQNAALGLELRGKAWAAADQVLAEVGLKGFGGRYPAQLSGGQRQRVAIARSLALSPDLLLMDEPFSALDALTREELQDLLLKLWQERQTTVVLVTHNIDEAVYLGKRILVLSEGPGRVAALLENPGAGQPGWRLEPAFHQLTVAVRQALEGGAGR